MEEPTITLPERSLRAFLVGLGAGKHYLVTDEAQKQGLAEQFADGCMAELRKEAVNPTPEQASSGTLVGFELDDGTIAYYEV
jgi:hypothetical protein